MVTNTQSEVLKREWTERLEQAQHEFKLAKIVPEMKQQRKLLKKEIESMRNLASVIELGYEPYQPNQEWYFGFLSSRLARKISGHRELTNIRVYKHAFPENVAKKYLEAKNTGKFEAFSIHSPQPDIFDTVRIKNIDPVLVGWTTCYIIHRWSANEHANLLGQSFLIATWDLEKDLAYKK